MIAPRREVRDASMAHNPLASQVSLREAVRSRNIFTSAIPELLEAAFENSQLRRVG